MNKEEIIKKHIEGWSGLQKASIDHFAESGKVSGSFFIALKSMLDEHANLQTEQLKKQLEDKEKGVEFFKKLNSELSLEFQKNQAEINELKKLLSVQKLKQTSFQSQLLEKDKELSELKAKHKILFDKILDVSKQDKSGDYKFAVALNLSQQMKEQYYTQTHGQ